MVAAAKLRRAQDSAEAARPYAERMGAVMPRCRVGVRLGFRSPPAGRDGADKVHLLVVMTAERGLCGGFNSSIVRLARAHANALLAQGKTVKILTVGKKGREQLKRDLAHLFVGHIDLSDVKRVGYAERAEAIATRRPVALRGGRVRCGHDVLQPLPVGDQPDPDGAAGDPRQVRGDGRHAALYDYEPAKRRSLPTSCRAASRPRSSPRFLENGASEQGARMSAMDNATRNAGDMINRLTIDLQPFASGCDHQGTYRNHFGRRGALTNRRNEMARSTDAATADGPR